MSISALLGAIDELQLTGRIAQDIWAYLQIEPDQEDAIIELTALVAVNVHTPIDVVTVAILREYYDVSFGNTVRVLAAIGGVTDVNHGIPRAGVCFATVYYNPQMKVITVDFHEDFR